MYSKWKPWDFIRNHPGVIDPSRPGVWCIEVFDAFMERFVVKKIPRDEEKSFHFFLGGELTEDFVDGQLLTRDMFSQGGELSLVIQAEDISKPLEKKVLENLNHVNDHFLILIFTSFQAALLKDLNKIAKAKSPTTQIHSIKMEAPAPWEDKKYIKFLAEEMRVSLPLEIIDCLVELLPLESGEYIQALNLIRADMLYHQSLSPSRPYRVSVDGVKKLITSGHIDQFSFAQDFLVKKFDRFFLRILERSADFDTLRNLFNFIETQLVKLMDLSTLEQKSYLTRWDKTLMSSRGMWTSSELRPWIREMSELNLMAKSKSEELVNRIRVLYYQSMI